MSSIETDLFAPIHVLQNEPWRTLCREIIADLQNRLGPTRPHGSLLLEELLECFFNYHQTIFWIVDSDNGTYDYQFNGSIYRDDNGFVTLNDPDGESVTALNLFPSHSTCFVFAEEADAEAYEHSLDI